MAEPTPSEVCPTCNGLGFEKRYEPGSTLDDRSSCAACDGTGKIPAPKTCPDCKGSGYALTLYSGEEPPTHICSTCNGDGRVPFDFKPYWFDGTVPKAGFNASDVIAGMEDFKALSKAPIMDADGNMIALEPLGEPTEQPIQGDFGHFVSKQVEFAIDDFTVHHKGIHGVIADRTNAILENHQRTLTQQLQARDAKWEAEINALERDLVEGDAVYPSQIDFLLTKMRGKQ